MNKIKELEGTIESMKMEIEKKEKKIEKLEKLKKGYENMCPLSIKYTICAEDHIIDVQEVYRLRETKRNYDALVMKIKGDNMDHKNKVLSNELLQKNDEIKKLTESNKAMEEMISQLTKKQNAWKNQAFKDKKGEQMQEREDIVLKEKELYDSKDEACIKRNLEVMTIELECLLARYKVAQVELRKREQTISSQNRAMEVLRKEVETKNTEILSLQQKNNKLFNQYRELKEKLCEAHQKVHNLNFGVINNMKLNLTEKDKTIRLLKEMIRGHNGEFKGHDTIKLKKGLISNRIDVISDKELLSKHGMSPDKSFLPDYQGQYLKKLESFCKAIKSRNYRNNSVNVRKVLSYKRELKSPKALRLNGSEDSLDCNKETNDYKVESIIEGTLNKGDINRNKLLHLNCKIGKLVHHELPMGKKPSNRNLKGTNRLLFT